MKNKMGFKQLEAIRKDNLSVPEFYTRVMEGIHSLGENPSDDDVRELKILLKTKGCKSLSEIEKNEEEFEVSKENKIMYTNLMHDNSKGKIKSAKYIIGSILDQPNTENLRKSTEMADSWFKLSEVSTLVNSSTYQANKASDLSFLFRKENIL